MYAYVVYYPVHGGVLLLWFVRLTVSGIVRKVTDEFS